MLKAMKAVVGQIGLKLLIQPVAAAMAIAIFFGELNPGQRTRTVTVGYCFLAGLCGTILANIISYATLFKILDMYFNSILLDKIRREVDQRIVAHNLLDEDE